MSRNLTFDRCWDTVVALDGDLATRSNAIAANHPLGDFIAALPKLALRRVSPERRQGIMKMAEELRRVRFTWPDGFDERQCRFWVTGLGGQAISPFDMRRDRSLIVSPFISDAVVRDFIDSGSATHLVSRPESLQELPQQTLNDCESVHFLHPQLSDELNDEVVAVGCGEVLDGLHAKLFVIDHGWEASVFSGSFNATVHALRHNVEFMVEMVGKKSQFGVDQFLRQVSGETRFADLLQEYDLNLVSTPTDPAAKELDNLFLAAKRALAAALPHLVVSSAGEPDLFNMELEWTRAPRWPQKQLDVRVWPITQPSDRALPLGERLVFNRLSYEGLTPLIAFSIAAEVSGLKRQSVFVMNLPLEGTPEDRQERVLTSLLAGRDQLLRYILFLLAAGDEASSSSGALAGLISETDSGGDRVLPLPCLLETLLRALHRGPAQLERVSSLLDALRKAPNGSELLNPEFQSIWEPIWQTARDSLRE